MEKIDAIAQKRLFSTLFKQEKVQNYLLQVGLEPLEPIPRIYFQAVYYACLNKACGQI